MMGAQVPVTERVSAEISRTVTAEAFVLGPGADGPAGGRLLHFPLDDEQCSVQLLYARLEPDDETTVYAVSFAPDFLAAWPLQWLSAHPALRRDATTEHQIPLCRASCEALEELFSAAAAIEGNALALALRRTELAVSLLRRALGAVALPFTACAVPACRFLHNDREREKIFLARDILEASTERPLTIREISRRVGINECYLKAGFKALVGTTVHEFQQARRVARATQMLKEEGYTVTAVADALGFSSIAHFSTAFKKATGLKPCELLR